MHDHNARVHQRSERQVRLVALGRSFERQGRQQRWLRRADVDFVALRVRLEHDTDHQIVHSRREALLHVVHPQLALRAFAKQAALGHHNLTVRRRGRRGSRGGE